MLKIGSAVLPLGLMLAPMAGFSDRAMRLVCRRFGAEFSITEMVSAKAIYYKDKKTAALARILSDEGPCAVQIFGSEPEIMAMAAREMSFGAPGGCAPVAIDINMGCPVNKVFGNGEGSALMKKPELIHDIVRAVSNNIDIPCTVKIRAGIDSEHINAVECALAAEEGGAEVVSVHGRTRVQMYSGLSDINVIRDVKESLHIPVIANGDVVRGVDAARLLRETGADGVMIGRGAIGNPFLFAEARAALSGCEYVEPSLEERIETALLQLSEAVKEKGEDVAVREARKQIALYLRSFRGAAVIRAKINRAFTFNEVAEAMRAALTEGELDL